MLLPGTVTFTAVIGGTFDTTVTLYDTRPEYENFGQWVPDETYPIYAVVIGTDNNGYVANAVTTGQDPTTNSVAWTELTPMNVTGWTATFQCNGTTPDFTLTSSGGGITLGGPAGTIVINAAPDLTAPFTEGKYPCYLKVVDASANTYFPLQGFILFKNALPDLITPC